MTGSLIDTNVLLDLVTADPTWLAWSKQQLKDAQARGPLVINPIIYAELASAFSTAEQLEQWVDPAYFTRAALPYAAAWAAGKAFVAYRRAGGLRTAPLPDFYIGAHAEIEGLTLVTRDAARYQTYFPKVKLIAP